MVAKRQDRNIITYSSLIAAADRTGRWEEGLTIWGHMSGDRCHPNLPAYNSAISCCAQGLLCCACCAVLCCAALRCGRWPAIISLIIKCSIQQGLTCDSVSKICSKFCCCAESLKANNCASAQFTGLSRNPLLCNNMFKIALSNTLTLLVLLVSQVRSGSKQGTSLSR